MLEVTKPGILCSFDARVQRVQETFLDDFHQCIQEDKRASQTWMLAANRTKVAFDIKLNALFRVPWAGWVSDA
jgi:hypothetical protein